MTRGDGSRIHERWAQLRFSVIGHLLAAPPAPGMLRGELQKLAMRAVAPSEHRRAGALRCLDDRTMAVPCPTRTARSGRRLEAQATQGRRHPRLPERGGARRAAGAIRRPSQLVGATTRRQPACARQGAARSFTAAVVLDDPSLLQGPGVVEAATLELARHGRRAARRGATRTPRGAQLRSRVCRRSVALGLSLRLAQDPHRPRRVGDAGAVRCSR